MLDTENKRRKEQQKQKVKKRYNVTIDPENYLFIPAKKQTDYYDNDVNQRVAIYVRVSTDDVRQTTSYELQKKYYEEFVTRHPNWTLVKIYADGTVFVPIPIVAVMPVVRSTSRIMVIAMTRAGFVFSLSASF